MLCVRAGQGEEGEGGAGKRRRWGRRKHYSAQNTHLEDDEGEEEWMRDIGWLVGRRMGTKALTGMLLSWYGGVVDGEGGEDRGG